MSSPVYQIQGREVRLPCDVREASSVAATYPVDAARARALLPGPEIELAEIWPGRALLSLACIDYRDNDLGSYDEISIAFFVRPHGEGGRIPFFSTAADLVRGRLGTWIHRLPVTESFSCEAGCGIWGFPKTVEDLSFEREGARASCSWRQDGRRVLTLHADRGGERTIPDAELVTYTWIEGVAHRVPFRSGATGAGIHALGGSRLDLGDHPIADELRGLGLPRRPLMTVWMERMHGLFDAPEKL